MERGTLKKEGKRLLDPCNKAVAFGDRFLGLMGKKSLPKTSGVYFPKCNSIHTFFMRISIDVIFLRKEGEVLEIVSSVKPWRLLIPRLPADSVVEMAEGVAEGLGIAVGDVLSWESGGTQ